MTEKISSDFLSTFVSDMTTFVDTSVLLAPEAARDQDPVIVVVRSAQSMLREGLGESESARFEKSFSEAYEGGNWGKVIDLLLGNAIVVFKKVSAAEDIERVSKTAEGYFEVTLSLLSKLGSVEEVVGKIDSFISTVIATEGVYMLKFKLLNTLFATLNPKVELRLKVIKGLCTLAVQNAKLAPQVYQLVKACDEWIAENDWELSDEEKADIFGLIASIAISSDRLRYLQAQLAYSPAASKSQLTEQLVIEAIRDSNTLRFDGIVAPESSVAGSCLRVLASGSLGDMESFIANNKSFLVSQGIEEAELVEKMRVMVVLRLASSELASGNACIAMKKIEELTKCIDAVQVVVRCISSGLLMGSIDEVNGVVRVQAIRETPKDVTRDLRAIQARVSIA